MWCVYTNLVSPHTAPLANALQVYAGGCVYIYQKHGGEPYRTKYVLNELLASAMCEEDDPETVRKLLLECEYLVLGVRDFDLIEKRIRLGRLTAYQSERWFKPESLLALGRSESAGRGVWISGFCKMLFPFAIRRAMRIMRLFMSEKFIYLPIGIHAARDMARLCGLMNGDLKCLFKAPELKFEKHPLSKIELKGGGGATRYCLEKMRMWGYFVAPSQMKRVAVKSPAHTLKILWVGRMLRLKNIDGIIRAVGGDDRFVLNVFGSGPDERRLRGLASKYDNVHFGEMMPLNEVRDIMREHDVYVLSSNEYDGWGAVVNEALEEGMRVLGTYEAGASATMLPDKYLFHSGDWRSLRELLIHSAGIAGGDGIGSWSVNEAAMSLARAVAEVRE